MLPLIGLALAFVLILTLLHFRISLGRTMAASVIVLALTANLPPRESLHTITSAILAPDTIDLLLSVLGITLLSAALKSLGFLNLAVNTLCELTGKPRVVTVIAPSLIGLLPVPGGAIVSAPLVDELGESMGMSPLRRAAANMVFRHSWFLVFPFNPHLILASRVAEIPLLTFIAILAPQAAASFIAGFLTLFRGTTTDPAPAATNSWQLIKRCLYALSPLILALGSYALLPIPLPLALVFGLCLAIFLAYHQQQLHILFSAMTRGINYDLLLAMTAIMTFRAFVIRMDQLPAVIQAVLDFGLPVELLLLIVPLAIAYISASMSTAVIVSFPLFLVIAGPGLPMLGFCAVIYTFAFIGHMLSPAHPCGPITASYFNIGFTDMTRTYLPSMYAAGITAIMLMIIFRTIS